ncbi:MAG: hypothetical protein RL398_1922 [Planctomycetota bacterium]
MPRLHTLLALAFTAAAAVGQGYYIPDSDPTLGACNVIPFGSTTPTGSFRTCLTQQIVTAADLGSTPGLITGLGFASCGTGTARYGRLQVIMDRVPANSTLSSTFAANLTASAVTVLDVTNHAWQVTGNQWVEIGLQDYFVADGVSDIVIQILCDTSSAPGGFHRSTTRPRVYATGWTGSPPATGTYSATTAQKMEFGVMMARVSTYGEGCAGSNGTPRMVVTGTPQPGQTVDLGMTAGPAFGLGVFVLGFYNGVPFPIDLGGFGAPGCYQYVAAEASIGTVLDATGSASNPFAVPAGGIFNGTRFYGQWACLDLGANALGVTVSNYTRVMLGN